MAIDEEYDELDGVDYNEEYLEDEGNDGFDEQQIRAEHEDDDGYDPYSDRIESTPLFEPDPWA